MKGGAGRGDRGHGTHNASAGLRRRTMCPRGMGRVGGAHRCRGGMGRSSRTNGGRLHNGAGRGAGVEPLGPEATLVRVGPANRRGRGGRREGTGRGMRGRPHISIRGEPAGPRNVEGAGVDRGRAVPSVCRGERAVCCRSAGGGQ